jgi:hypothetical protein
MALTQEQIELAARIEAKVQRLSGLGCDELDIFIELFDGMHAFKRLMDTVGQSGRDELARRFAGLLRYAEIVETVDAAIDQGNSK